MMKLYFIKEIGGIIAKWSEIEIPNNIGCVEITQEEWKKVYFEDPASPIEQGIIDAFEVVITPGPGPNGHNLVKQICIAIGVPESHILDDAIECYDEDGEIWSIPVPISHVNHPDSDPDAECVDILVEVNGEQYHIEGELSY